MHVETEWAPTKEAVSAGVTRPSHGYGRDQRLVPACRDAGPASHSLSETRSCTVGARAAPRDGQQSCRRSVAPAGVARSDRQPMRFSLESSNGHARISSFIAAAYSPLFSGWNALMSANAS